MPRRSWRTLREALRAPWEGRALPALLVGMALLCLLSAPPFAHYFGSIVLQRLPFPEQDRLVSLAETNRRNATSPVRAYTFQRWARDLKSLEGMALYGYARYTEHPSGRSLLAGRASTGFFDLLGVRMHLGRTPVPAEPRPPARRYRYWHRALQPAPVEERTVVLSYPYWRKTLQGDRAVVGRTLRLSGEDHRIVGVLPPDFDFALRNVQVWTTFAVTTDPWALLRSTHQGAVGRLKPGRSLEAAQAELAQASAWLAWESPATHRRRSAQMIPLHQAPVRDLVPALVMILLPTSVGIFLAFARMAEEWTRRRWAGVRYWSFFLGRLALGGTLLLLVWIQLLDVAYPWAPSNAWLAALQWGIDVGFFASCCGFVWWAWRDQRTLCRVCFSRLRMPLDSGAFASVLFDRPGAEYICPQGHGQLYIPLHRPADAGESQWTASGGLWDELSRPS